MSVAVYQASLFDAPPEPVLAESSGWITGLLGGPLAVSLCVIAVALLGMLMLTGRLPMRRGGQAVMGCFLLFGGSVFGSSLVDLAGGPASSASVIIPPIASSPITPTEPARANPFDPYSGASLSNNR